MPGAPPPPGAAPYRNPRSIEAEARQGATSAKEQRVLALLSAAPSGGLTTFEIESITGWKHQSASALVSRMWHHKRLIRPSGRTRRTDTGRRADVYEVGDPLADDAPMQPPAGRGDTR